MEEKKHRSIPGHGTYGIFCIFDIEDFLIWYIGRTLCEYSASDDLHLRGDLDQSGVGCHGRPLFEDRRQGRIGSFGRDYRYQEVRILRQFPSHNWGSRSKEIRQKRNYKKDKSFHHTPGLPSRLHFESLWRRLVKAWRTSTKKLKFLYDDTNYISVFIL